MSRLPLRSFLLSLAACGALAAACFGFAGAGSVEGMLQGGLTPSALPGLLGPISESGRTGWECKPEIAAAARSAKEADLPVLPAK